MTEENTPSESDIFSSPEAFSAALKQENALPAPKEETREDEEGDESQEDKEADNDGDSGDDRYVPKTRLDKETKKRRAAESELDEVRDAKRRAEIDLDNLNKTLQQYFKAPEEQTEHPEEDDFIPLDLEAKAYFDKKLQKLEKKNEELTTRLQKKEEKDDQYNAASEYGNALAQQQKQFERGNPDFMNAYRFVLKAKYDEYIELGYDEKEANAATWEEMQHKAAATFKKGKNVAEAAYSLAKKYGYKTKEGAGKEGDNFETLRTNMKKSSSISTVAAASTAGAGVNLGDRESVQKNLTTSERGFIDPAKFAALLKKQQNLQRV